MAKVLPTAFAPAELAAPEELDEQIGWFQDQSLVDQLVNAVPDMFMVLNKQRQIVYANLSLLDSIQAADISHVTGKRTGEVLNCVHATETEGGCGTTEFCRTCGSAQAILSSLRNQAAVQECRIIQANGGALDLRIWATPLVMHDQPMAIYAVKDISHEKRRRVLERIFFHDILNTAGGVRGFTELLLEAQVDDLDEIKQILYTLSDRLIEEIKTQRELTAAENNDLTVRIVALDTLALLHETAELYRNHEVIQGRRIIIEPDSAAVAIASDRTLLRRVLGNMVKNALEASSTGETVTLGCHAGADFIEFHVHNPAVMPRTVQLQIFQRSFSTKGGGRGLGTYSMKLLSERYLNGKVYFTSQLDQGTTFYARYPR